MVKGGVRSKNYWGHHSRLEAVLESLESEREKSSHSANVWSLFMISPELVLWELSKTQEREFRTSCLYPLKIIKKFESKSAKLQNCHGYQNLMFHSIHYNCSHSLARLKCLMLSKNGRCTHPNKSPRVSLGSWKFSPAQKGPKKYFLHRRFFNCHPFY